MLDARTRWYGKGFLATICLALAGGSSIACRESAPVARDPMPPAETSLAEQAAAVRAGLSQQIRLDHTLVRDEDLAPLESLEPGPRRINLSRTEITDAGLARLCEHESLEQLRLSSRHVTDEGLAAIGRLKHLRFLHLLDMPITDAGLDKLHGLGTLESLYLDGTRVTDEGLARLLAALPAVHLHIDDHHHRLDPRAKDHEH